MADRSVSVLMTLSDTERRDARGHNFQAHLLITLESFDLAAEGHISMVSGSPHCKGYPSAVRFWDALLFLRTSFDAELPNLMWAGLVFRRSITVQPQTGGAPALHNFAGFLSMTTL